MTAPTLSFANVCHHAKGAWPYRTGEMTHSGDGTVTLPNGEIISFDVSRYYVRGEGTSYTVALYSAARRELTAAKWEAIKDSITRKFSRYVRAMAELPRPHSIKPAADAALVAEYVEAAAASGDDWHIANAAEHAAVLEDGGKFDAAATREGIAQARALVAPAPAPLCPRCDSYGAAQGDCSTCWSGPVEADPVAALMAPGAAPSMAELVEALTVTLEGWPSMATVAEHRANRSRAVGLVSAMRRNLSASEAVEAAPPLALAVMSPDAARLAGATLDNPPVVDRGGVRTDGEGRQFIDMTPTWSEILPTLLVLVTDGDSKGQAFAREELARAAGMADKFTAARKAFAGLSAGEAR